MNDIPIGRAVRALRQHKRIAMGELSELAGMHLNTLERIEQGVQGPEWKTLMKLATALQVQPYKLLRLAERMGGKEVEVAV